MGGLRALCCNKADRENDDQHNPPTPSAQPQPDMKIARIPANIKSQSTLTEVAQEKSSPRDLWKEAYDELGPELTKYLSENSTSATDAIHVVIKETTARYEQWKKGGLRIARKDGDDINIRDSVEKIINAAMKASDLISKFVSLDPTGHASSAWTVISFGMSIVQNTLDRRDAIFAASEYLAETLAYYSLIDANYRDQGVGSDHNLNQALLRIYLAILTFAAEVKKAQNESAGVRPLKAVFALTEQPLGQLKDAIATQSEATQQWASLAANLGDRKVAAAHLAKIKSVESKVLTAEEEKQLDWMSTAAFSSRQRDLQKKRTDGTGNWLLDLNEYTDWKSNPGKILWLPGISGCGKSVLCSTVIHDIENDCESDDSKYVAYWYFDFSDEKSQIVDIMARSLIRQLSRSPLLPSVIKIWEDHHLRGSQPDSRAIYDLLDNVISNISGHVYLVLDALDECPENAKSKERMTLLPLLTGLVERHKKKLHILATSRPEQDIKQELYAFSIIDLEVHLDDDVRSFVKTSLKQGQLKKLNQDLKYLIREKLLSSKERRFRWAELQIAEIENCYTEKDIKAALSSVPRTLEATYYKILDVFTPRTVPLAREILLLICLSPIALDVETVAAAVGLDFPEAVLKICTTALVSEVDGKLRFAHFSVQEFLIVSEKDSQHHECQFSIIDGHNSLATSTIDCLLDQTIVLTRLVSMQQPFFKYAAKYWNAHVTASMEADRPPDFQTKMHRLFTEPNVYFNWARVIDKDCTLWNDSRENRIEDCEQPIQVASRMGLFQSVEDLLNEGIHPDATGVRGEQGYALQLASNAGYEKIVALLLNRGADINAPAVFYRTTALQQATLPGHENVVQLLLERGADVSPNRGGDGAALHIASCRGYYRIVEMLLNHRADIHGHGGEFDNALQAASCEGHENIVRILLDHGADVNRQGGRFDNALQVASYQGHEKIVQILLDHGADVNLLGGKFGTALQDTAIGDHKEIMQILFDRNADINLNGTNWGNALYAAADNGYASTVQMLLDRGADIDAPEELYGSLLQPAAKRKERDIVQILLDHGADIRFQGGIFGNALHAALSGKDEDIVRMLLDRGADVNFQGIYGSPLRIACSRGNEKAVEILLDHGADVNAQGGERQSPIQEASSNGHEKIVQMLLERGAKLDAQQRLGFNLYKDPQGN
ncbi:hypothetical protein N7540_008430 [Penicillium herquei]|nr:hypothetical protein N7540_008430 [Penicillium herquei]